MRHTVGLRFLYSRRLPLSVPHKELATTEGHGPAVGMQEQQRINPVRAIQRARLISLTSARRKHVRNALAYGHAQTGSRMDVLKMDHETLSRAAAHSFGLVLQGHCHVTCRDRSLMGQTAQEALLDAAAKEGARGACRCDVLPRIPTSCHYQ